MNSIPELCALLVGAVEGKIVKAISITNMAAACRSRLLREFDFVDFIVCNSPFNGLRKS
jgi:hypothetical protein